MIHIQLTDDEIKDCEEVAKSRQGVKEKYNVATKKYVQRYDDLQIHRIGVQTEFAVAKYLGIDIDREISPSGDDKITDLIYDDVRIQVRARAKRKDGDLFFNNLKDFKADVAVLVIWNESGNMDIAGWTTKKNFAKHHYENNFGHGKRFCLTQYYLKEIDDLEKRLLEKHV